LGDEGYIDKALVEEVDELGGVQDNPEDFELVFQVFRAYFDHLVVQ